MKNELQNTVDHDNVQIDHWRQTCTKLTTLIEDKDRDLREANALRKEAENATERAQENFREIELEVNNYMFLYFGLCLIPDIF